MQLQKTKTIISSIGIKVEKIETGNHRALHIVDTAQVKKKIHLKLNKMKREKCHKVFTMVRKKSTMTEDPVIDL